MKPLLLTSYVSPDLDGVSGIVAYAELLNLSGRSAVAFVMDPVQAEVVYIAEHFGISLPPELQNVSDFDRIGLVDVSEVRLLENRVPLDKVVEVIDHRAVNDITSFPNASAQIELVGAVATLITERFISKGLRPSKTSAVLLHAAIISNTLNFKGSVTTDRDRKAAAFLSTISLLPSDFWKEMFAAKSAMPGDLLAERLRGDFSQWSFNGVKIGAAQLELVGAVSLLKDRCGEIVELLQAIKKELGMAHVFLNIVDLETEQNFFVVACDDTKPLFSKILEVAFDRNVAARKGLLLRKQISPLLKKSSARSLYREFAYE